MRKLLFTTPIFILLAFFLFGCYTQLQVVDRGNDGRYSVEYDEEYYLTENDSLESDAQIIQNYHFYGNAGYYGFYDPFYDPYYDPWYWGPSPRWGLYIGFSSWWGHPYWHNPWGWGYPIINPYYGYHYPYYYWDYYYPPVYYYDGGSRNYARRPFDRRSPVSGRYATGERSSGSTDASANINRVSRRGSGTSTQIASSGERTTDSRIIRRNLDNSKRIYRDDVYTSTRSSSSTRRTSSDRSTISKPSSSDRKSSGTRSVPTYRKKSTSSSGSSVTKRKSSSRQSSSPSYSPRSRSSGSGSSSSGRSSGSSSRSSSSGSRKSSSSSNSGSSRR